jgi:alpha-glucosidase
MLSRVPSPNEPTPSDHAWWRTAAIYQVYPRSFADANGDGVGDLGGIIAHLHDIAALGVDAIWLSPFYPSPQADAGYDVADYRDVDPLFGTLDDFDAMLEAAHDLDLRVIVDIVPNHTSSEHAWFRAALAAPPGSPERARYLFREGRGPDGSEPPNDWTSTFGGPAWTRLVDADDVPGQWYLHLFAPEQPDLDWTNEEVRDEFESVLRFWLDRGVDGFRIDVAHGLAKDPEMPDLAGRFRARSGDREGHPHWDQDEVHEVFRDWRRVTDAYPGDRAFVAEAWVASPERLARYLRADELHTAFNFDFLRAPWDAAELRRIIDENIGALAAVGATPTWVLSNHDVVRPVTRYGGGELGTRRARAGALLMLALPGGAYVFQGEELGLPEVEDLPAEVRQDPVFLRTGGKEAGRDGCRVPLPWSGSEPPFGFSASGSTWLPQPVEWAALTVERQAGEAGSMLALYRSALRLRRQVVEQGAPLTLDWVESAPGVLAFHRSSRFACVVNVGDDEAPLPRELVGAEVILASDPNAAGDGVLPGGSAVWLRPSTEVAK